MRQRLASSEYSTRCTGGLLVADDERRSSQRVPARAAGCSSMRGGDVVDVEARALQLAVSAVAGEFDGASDAATLNDIGAVGHRRRVPHDDRIPDARLQRLPGRFAFAAVGDVELQAIVVLVLRLPDERLQTFLVDAAAERRRSGAAARRARRCAWLGGRPSDVLSSKPAISTSPVENGRWKTVPGGCTVIDVTSGRRLRGR